MEVNVIGTKTDREDTAFAPGRLVIICPDLIVIIWLSAFRDSGYLTPKSFFEDLNSGDRGVRRYMIQVAKKILDAAQERFCPAFGHEVELGEFMLGNLFRRLSFGDNRYEIGEQIVAREVRVI